jgi:hypothetical protein
VMWVRNPRLSVYGRLKTHNNKTGETAETEARLQMHLRGLSNEYIFALARNQI